MPLVRQLKLAPMVGLLQTIKSVSVRVQAQPWALDYYLPSGALQLGWAVGRLFDDMTMIY